MMPSQMETPPNPTDTMHPAVDATRWLAAGSLLALIALGLAWELWLAPLPSGLLALKVVPLAFPLAGILKRRLYTYRWASLLVWPYVAEGAVRAWPYHWPTTQLAAAEIALGVLLFAACATHVRLRLRKKSS
jgi:uncharacterized membrane protein